MLNREGWNAGDRGGAKNKQIRREWRCIQERRRAMRDAQRAARPAHMPDLSMKREQLGLLGLKPGLFGSQQQS